MCEYNNCLASYNNAISCTSFPHALSVMEHMSALEARFALIEARLSRLENPGMPAILAPSKPPTATAAPSSSIVKQTPAPTLAPRVSTAAVDSYIVFVLESPKDAPIIHQAAGHADFPTYEIIISNTLQEHEKRYIQDRAFVCRVRSPTGRMSDNTVGDILYYAQKFGNDRTLLLMVWSFVDASQVQLDRVALVIKQGILFTSPSGTIRNRLLHWKCKPQFTGPVDNELLEIDASVKRLVQVMQEISQ